MKTLFLVFALFPIQGNNFTLNNENLGYILNLGFGERAITNCQDTTYFTISFENEVSDTFTHFAGKWCFKYTEEKLPRMLNFTEYKFADDGLYLYYTQQCGGRYEGKFYLTKKAESMLYTPENVSYIHSSH